MTALPEFPAPVHQALERALDLPATAPPAIVVSAAELVLESCLLEGPGSVDQALPLARRAAEAGPGACRALLLAWSLSADPAPAHTALGLAMGAADDSVGRLARILVGSCLGEPGLTRSGVQAEDLAGDEFADRPPTLARPLLAAVEAALAAFERGDDARALVRAEALARGLRAFLEDQDLVLAADSWLVLQRLYAHRQDRAPEMPAKLAERVSDPGPTLPEQLAAARALVRERLFPIRINLVGNLGDPRTAVFLEPLRRLLWPRLTLVPLHPLIGTHFANSGLQPDPTAMLEAGGRIVPAIRSAGSLRSQLESLSPAWGWQRQLETAFSA